MQAAAVGGLQLEGPCGGKGTCGQNGDTLGIASSTNMQNIFGSDVVSRIEHTISDLQGLDQLQKRAVKTINDLIEMLSTKTGILSMNIYKVMAVENTTMEHLFLGLDPRYLARAPFTPVMTHPVELEAREIGLRVNPHAEVCLIPNIAGYVGGDTTSAIIATRVYEKSGIYLIVDIGTNGEMVLSIDGNMLACSTAAGPAFEGAQIKCGMRAAPGAIEGVVFDGDISLKVIENIVPTGICGSGLLQAVQVMVSTGVLLSGGKMLNRKEAEKKGLPSSLIERLGADESGNFFVLSHPGGIQEGIIITQGDVRALQLAKGAIRTGIEVLLKEAGITAGDITQVLMAGAFGNYIDKESALSLGLLPKVDPEKICLVGNAAGTGAQMALLSDNFWEKAYDVSQKVRHIELSGRKDFHEMFMKYLGLHS
ncbi:MAG: ATP-binding protein [Peptococcaceae bacterium]|nr:ATP-binding protein [Peptococcaceae bacterium]